ncbi:lipid-A-disaccharide synthase-like uncharacterized protein [Balneicella halophila]|uniref:Lipid-A-disaccharide synthase-like uncharacterized protein n=1 Tax=Balneicella halophila TaxID=1537566 RepID=A0A7L4UPL4_BALHA|nr:lipid-A-disaccharide synthase N-terminal domain-containing protein [Balneicella halophila]PVX51735.1 lipid-A-disaccharide synthase-like uncharacterized protein [Balneicella halophila]
MGFEITYVALIGFIAQGLFFSRFAVQLILSERAKASISPSIFWQLSLIACYLMMTYGYLRNDFSIIEGQIIAYFIYIRNLQLKGVWGKVPKLIKLILIATPILVIGYGLFNYVDIVKPLFRDPPATATWLILATIGQTIFASRFIYQWVYSEYKKESIFPLGFWVISILGSAIITVYAIFAKDLVLLIGQGFGLIVYSRNFYLRLLENKKNEEVSI